MKCPMCENNKLVELDIESDAYNRGYNYKCKKCRKFWNIVAEDF